MYCTSQTISRRRRLFSWLVLVVLAQPSWAVGTPDGAVDRAGKGALGALIGGVIGNQVGGGQGRTAATAVGAAAGTVIASGCRVTGGTVLGGLLGGLLGSQVGGGNGRDAMAGAGAAVSAYIGSDCSPVATALPPVPTELPPIEINGLRVVPMTGFPLEAFGGIPPITTPQDMAAAAQVVKALTDQAKVAYQQGDAETGLYALYWAKRVSAVAVGIVDASQQAIMSTRAGRTAVPGKALAILPAFNQHNDLARTAALMQTWIVEAEQVFDSPRLTAGVLVADNSVNGVLNVLKAFGQPGAASPQPKAPAGAGQSGQVATTPPEMPRALQGFPENQVLRLPDGTMVMKSGEALTIYNATDAPVQVPLDQLDFVPRTPDPSPARIAAADLMKTITNNEREWSFNIYFPASRGRARSEFKAPNLIFDDRNQRIAAYVAANGTVSYSPSDGQAAYRQQPAFRLAMDLLDATDHSLPVRSFHNGCVDLSKGVFAEYQGRYANLSKRICFSGKYSSPAVFRSKTFYVGENGKAILTMESLLEDRAIIATMNKALADGQSLSDLISFVPVLGNLENANQCLGASTFAQQAAVRKALGREANAKARLAGWQEPDPTEWSLDRVANCLGALPIIGQASAGARAGAKDAGKVVAALGERADQVRSVFSAFESPKTFAGFLAKAASIEDILPGNAKAGQLVRTIYAGLMSGQNMTATASGAWHFAGQ